MNGELQSLLASTLAILPGVTLTGRITAIAGTIVEASLPGCAIGDLVAVERRRGLGNATGQIVGSRGETASIMMSEATDGIPIGAPVRSSCRPAGITVGRHLLGTVIDGSGRLMSESLLPLPSPAPPPDVSWRPLDARPPKPLERAPLDSLLHTGIRAIDLFTPIAHGQRLLISAEPGVGKSTLLAQLARFAAVDVAVIALIGERGREVGEFLNDVLTPESRGRTVVVVSTSDDPPLARAHAAVLAMTIAEYFRDIGCRVLLEIDSLTRLARALRELGLAAGELPVRRGYPPSVFARLPALLERAGRTLSGSITALCTMLLSTDLEEDPMVEEVKGLVDGHIQLSAALAQRGVFPAIDVEHSLSRLAARVAPPDRYTAAGNIRARLREIARIRETLIIGGTCTADDRRTLAFEEPLRRFLHQRSDEHISAAALCTAVADLTSAL